MNYFSERAKNEKNQLKTMQRLGEFINFHAEVKQLSNNDLYPTLTYSLHIEYTKHHNWSIFDIIK